jgi:hypothetical protein
MFSGALKGGGQSRRKKQQKKAADRRGSKRKGLVSTAPASLSQSAADNGIAGRSLRLSAYLAVVVITTSLSRPSAPCEA